MINKESKKGIEEKKARSSLFRWVGYTGVLIAVLITVTISWVLYEHTVNLLTVNLHKRLIAIVKTASVQISYNDIDALQEQDDYKKEEYRRVVNQMLDMRLNNEDIVFMYILRRDNKDTSQMVFVADSHSLDPYAKVDLDGNGVIDDADALNWPGQIYEDVPQEAFDGYSSVTTNKELYEDQWGVLISGYAPILRDDGSVAGVLAIDIRADDFFMITRQTLYPFLIYIIVLVIILLVLASGLISIWSKRISLFAELDRQKDELLSIVSHQLATPVSSVKWYMEMMLDGDTGKLTDEQKEHVTTVKNVTGDLVDLIGMILNVSRIQLGRMKVDRSDLDLKTFFKEILAIIEPKVAEKHIKFQKNIPEKLPFAMLDRRLMHMTLENLLSNAVKYTPEGGEVTLDVVVENKALSYTISDTGCGIPKGEQEHVFDKLFRATNVQKVNGNGFGLYVAKGAVEAQGGTIRFESSKDNGTTFFVQLPLEESG